MPYISPFAKSNAPQPSAPMHPDQSSAYYISPIKGSQFTADYWKNVEQQNAQMKLATDLKTVASGSMSMPYAQKIATINESAKQGLIDKKTQLQLINDTVNRSHIGQPTGFWTRLSQWGAQQVYDAVNSTAKFANQGINMANQVGETLGAGLAQAVGNKKVFQGEQKQIQSEYNKYGSTGGILNQGTVNTKQEAKNPTLGAGVKIGAAAVNTLSQFIFPEGKAAVSAAKAGSVLLKGLGEENLVNIAAKAGIETTGKAATDVAKELVASKAGQVTIKTLINSSHGAVQGGIYGASGEAAQGKGAKDILKGGAEGAAFGAGLGAAGTIASHGVEALKGKISTAKDAPVSSPAEKLKVNNIKVNQTSIKESATSKLKISQESKGVIQIVNNDKGTKQYISPDTPKAYAEAKQRIDNARVANGDKNNGIAGVKQSNGDVYHITARTPKEMEQRGFTKVNESKISEGNVAGGATKLESRAVQQGLAKEFENKATYTPQSFKKNAEDAVNLVHDNPKEAMDIATGKVPGNNTIHESAVFHAVKEKALKEGDVNTIQKLASSAHYTKTSEAAQKLGMESYNAVHHDPVKAIQEVRDARQAAFERNSKTTLKGETARAVKTVKMATKAPTKNDWASLIEQLRCK